MVRRSPAIKRFKRRIEGADSSNTHIEKGLSRSQAQVESSPQSGVFRDLVKALVTRSRGPLLPGLSEDIAFSDLGRVDLLEEFALSQGRLNSLHLSEIQSLKARLQALEDRVSAFESSSYSPSRSPSRNRR